MEQQFEEAKKILNWREMTPGVTYKYHGIQYRGKNSCDKPIRVITLETKDGVEMCYAPASLYWELIRRAKTSYIRYDGLQNVGINIPFSSLQIETKKMNYLMAEQNDPALTDDVMKMLEVEPAQPIEAPVAMLAGPDIPALPEQLAILVSTGKCKEAIGTEMTHDQVKRLSDKEVMRAHKRYKTYVAAKTTETLIDSFLSFATKALGLVVRLKDTEALQNELKNDYIITKELSNLSGSLALRCGRMLAVANAFLITAKHDDFSADEKAEQTAEQSSVTAEETAE